MNPTSFIATPREPPPKGWTRTRTTITITVDTVEGRAVSWREILKEMADAFDQPLAAHGDGFVVRTTSMFTSIE